MSLLECYKKVQVDASSTHFIGVIKVMSTGFNPCPLKALSGLCDLCTNSIGVKPETCNMKMFLT